MLGRYTDVAAFHRDVIGILAKREVENNLPIGILHRGLTGEDSGGWWMAMQGEGEGALISLMTPPYNLILCGDSATDGQLRELAAALDENGFAPGGVNGEVAPARRFAEIYAREHGRAVSVRSNMRIYILDKVEDVPLVGDVREFREEDVCFAPYWMWAMAVDCRMEHTLEDRVKAFEHYLDPSNEGRGYVLTVDGQPVSMAVLGRVLPHGRAVGGVYTPFFYRGKGYATSCVAQISRIALEMGNEYCTLFTDLANPTSNSIYQKIGYRPVGDYVDLRFATA